MAGDKFGSDRFFAGFLMLAVAALITIGVIIFPHRDRVPEPSAATGGSREVPAPGNPPTPVGADTPAPAPAPATK